MFELLYVKTEQMLQFMVFTNYLFPIQPSCDAHLKGFFALIVTNIIFIRIKILWNN